jgi:hypothetical protein
MPFPFILPTTSSFSFSSAFNSDSHPSLPLNASTYRGVMRDTLKKHKRLPPTAKPASVSTVVASLNGYVPYLLAVDAGLTDNKTHYAEDIQVVAKSPLTVEWRPTLSENAVPGREKARAKVQALDYEICFTLTTLANAYTLMARSCLHPLYSTSIATLETQDRTAAIQAATRYLLDSASICDYMATRLEKVTAAPPCVDVAPSTVRALSCLALAEATLLAVLKDDPYPAVVAQDRNKHDKEWMYKAPDIPKVRAHLFARLCLAGSEHAAKALALCQSAGKMSNKTNEGLVKYLDDLRRTSRAKACRFFGIDAELGGQTGNALGWLNAGLQELGVEIKDHKKGLGFSRLAKEWSDKREDRKVDKETTWGADAGKLEETRVIEMLSAKWNKLNDTVRYSRRDVQIL